MVAVKSFAAGCALWLAGLSAAGAHDAAKPADPHAAHMGMQAAAAAQKQPLATGAAFDARHRLWAAWVEGEHVVVAHSDDAGRKLSAAVTVNAMPEPIYTSAENRPKVAASPDGRAIYVSWSMPLDAPYTGMVRFSRSLDGGATWSVPITVHRDRQMITHRFDMMAVDPAGRIYLAWIDKRDLTAAKAAGQAYDGAAIYYAVSRDGGASFEPERKVTDHTCECCRIAMAIDPAGRVEAAWRNVFPGQIRDHALAVLPASADAPVAPLRATFSNWHVEACPDHGPALAITSDGTRHLAWFGVVDGRADVFYSRIAADGRPLGAAWAFGANPAAPGEQASHAAMVARGDIVWLAWKAFDGDTMQIKLRRSDDRGAHWSEPRVIASTSGASDNPQLLDDTGRVYLSWRTRNDGYRLIAVEGGQ
ncbi:sialidase family protein [Burkholderia stagnalis]|uniref:sialidase family protein n=1 Tax=Burkholderia stagnalis TaxID=1503054 RepID=UPI000752C659|nr:sialidase family protein [Burkholderia stagnalis]KVM97273.1 glycosyl hydrolase [Burkholderia stagnalis]KVN61775.1 glycosyl hydrolase [Burkholderia stagnalis]KWE12155.1 glycosyl hydrolase [Burkholderia stagnalis]KWE20995.1 glycosyl hydrolase [Burkholderia stagnalis]KWO72554.1 glycosyl hydrolase [Burkholderia stagnalis]